MRRYFGGISCIFAADAVVILAWLLGYIFFRISIAIATRVSIFFFLFFDMHVDLKKSFFFFFFLLCNPFIPMNYLYRIKLRSRITTE